MNDLRIKTGDITLQVREYARKGETVLFLHFGGGNLMIWQAVVPYFQDRYRLILLDLRDHGKSDKPQKEAHIDSMAADVAGVLDQMQIKQAHVIGSSLGAEVGLSLAVQFPEKVASLVCEGALYSEYGPYGIWDGSEAAFKEYVARSLAEVHAEADQVFPSAEALLAAGRQKFEKQGWWNDYVAAFLEYDAFEVTPGSFTHSWQNRAKKNYLEHYYGYRFEEYYRRLKCPVLMLPGEDEMGEKRIKTALEGLIQLVKQGKIAAVPGWVHAYGWMLNPEAASKQVLKFLS